MSLAERFLSEKRAVASLVNRFSDPSSSQKLTNVLELELLDQIRFDHREVAQDELLGCWNNSPTIAVLRGQAGESDLFELKNSTYAFRLMTLAQVLVRLPEAAKPEFSRLLQDFGLGLQEVESYATDFVR